jgi:hypothetical protein
MRGERRLLKYVEEAEFGPDAGVNTVFVIGSLDSKLDGPQGNGRFGSITGYRLPSETLCKKAPNSDLAVWL